MNTFQVILLIGCIIFQTIAFVAYRIARSIISCDPKNSEWFWRLSVVSVVIAGICATVGIMSN